MSVQKIRGAVSREIQTAGFHYSLGSFFQTVVHKTNLELLIGIFFSSKIEEREGKAREGKKKNGGGVGKG